MSKNIFCSKNNKNTKIYVRSGPLNGDGFTSDNLSIAAARQARLDVIFVRTSSSPDCTADYVEERNRRTLLDTGLCVVLRYADFSVLF